MLQILLGSVVGIGEGLYVDYRLYIVLSFLLLLTASFFINKYGEKISWKKVLMFWICSFIWFFITKGLLLQYDTKYIEGEISMQLQMLSEGEKKEQYVRYLCRNEQGDQFLLYVSYPSFLHKGDTIKGKGNFVLPDVAKNSGGFNYRRYLNSQKIYGSIWLEQYDVMDLAKWNLLDALRKDIQETLATFFPDNEMGLVIGMMIGDTRGMSDEVLQDFKETGITHLVAVSGANVMYVFLCIQFLFGKICGKRMTNVISICFLLFFMFLSGASSSVVRATVMAILVILANLFLQKSDTMHNIMFSALVLILWNPLVLCDVGFLLSFGGTLGIVLFSNDLKSYFSFCGKAQDTLAVTCSAQLMLLPIMAYYFHSISLIAILSNLIVVPISGFITILGFFLYLLAKVFFPVAFILSKGLYVLTHFTILVAQFFSQFPFASLQVVTPNWLEIGVYYGIFWCVMKKKITWKKAGMIFLLVLFLESVYSIFPLGGIHVNCIDVGQGDAFLIESNHHKTILIDGGGSKTYDVGENILVPYLLSHRITHLDCIISSHSDADHLYGILTVMEQFSVDTVLIAQGALGYESLEELAEQKGIEVKQLAYGDTFTLDDILFQVVGPVIGISPQEVNDYSLVLTMQYAGKTVLWTGDISQEAETLLRPLSVDILKVGHHGSSTSSSESFLVAVQPSIALISVGKNNSFGHPNEEVLQRIQRLRNESLSNR